MKDQKLKASFTLENSFIMPLFIIIIVLLLYVCFYVHDAVILKNSALKLAIRAEDVCEQDWAITELRQAGIDYIKGKTICTQNMNVIIEDNKGEIKVTCTGDFSSGLRLMNQTGLLNQSATVNKSKPDNFIRMINAVSDVIR